MSGTTDRYKKNFLKPFKLLLGWMISWVMDVLSNFLLYLHWQESYNHRVTESNPCSRVHDNAEGSFCF